MGKAVFQYIRSRNHPSALEGASLVVITGVVSRHLVKMFIDLLKT